MANHLQAGFEYGLITVFLLGLSTVNVWAQKPRLLDEIRADLTRHAGKWRFAANRTSDGVRCTARVAGDFDGNGQTDYAVYIEAGKGTHETRWRLIVYLQKDGGFERRTLERTLTEADRCLHLFRKGANDYNYETSKHFRYQHDTVFLYYPEKAGASYVFWRGRFYRIATSD